MAGLVEGILWDVEIYQLETDDPVVGGPPNTVTLAGIDNVPHQQLARRTQWLKSRQGSMVNTRTVTASAVLDDTDVGRMLVVSSAATLTLPDATAVGAGAVIRAISFVDGTIIQAAGADVIYGLGAAAVTSGGINARGTLALVSTGAAWVAYDGSLQLASAAAFDNALAANGYQRLPTGLFVQWGTAVTSAATGKVTVTWPTAFLTACYGAVATHTGGGGAIIIVDAASGGLSATQGKFGVSMAFGALSNVAHSFHFQAIGK